MFKIKSACNKATLITVTLSSALTLGGAAFATHSNQHRADSTINSALKECASFAGIYRVFCKSGGDPLPEFSATIEQDTCVRVTLRTKEPVAFERMIAFFNYASVSAKTEAGNNEKVGWGLTGDQVYAVLSDRETSHSGKRSTVHHHLNAKGGQGERCDSPIVYYSTKTVHDMTKWPSGSTVTSMQCEFCPQ